MTIESPLSASKIVAATCETATSGPLFFDLETIPDPRIELPGDERPAIAIAQSDPFKTVDQAKAYLNEYRLTQNQLDGLASVEYENKNRAGVIAAIQAEEKRQSDREESDRLTLSTVPEYCRIAAMGWAAGEDKVRSVVCKTLEDEAAALEAWWKLVELFGQPCGYNIIAFDLPVIFVRSALLGVAPTRRLDFRPWSDSQIDLYAKRFPRGSSGRQPGKLKDLAPLYGIEVPAGDVDGSQVAELFESDPDKLGEYVRSDVQITRELHYRWRGLFT